MKTKNTGDFITWADIALLSALFGFATEQRSLRRAVLVNTEGSQARRVIAKLTPTGWRADFS